MQKKKRIAVIFGGQSSEHEVSRISAQSVINNINRELFDVEMIGITKEGTWIRYDGPVEKIGTGEWQAIASKGAIMEKSDLNSHSLTVPGTSVRNIIQASGVEPQSGGIDVIFPVLHGCNGEDGTIQGLFELAGIPYVGCGVLGSALGMDKAYSKIIFEREGIPQGKYVVLDRKQIVRQPDWAVAQVEKVLAYPCFVKPSNSGSSVGVSKAHDRKELVDSLNSASKYDRRILVEEFIDGREIECAILGNDEPEASTVGEIVPCNEFYDYTAKYNSGDESKVIIPADLPQKTIEEIRYYAVKAFKALDCSGLSRIDFFVHKDTGKIYINEINTLPGFTSISMYAKLWDASGVPYPKLVERLIELALERYEDTRRDFCTD